MLLAIASAEAEGLQSAAMEPALDKTMPHLLSTTREEANSLPTRGEPPPHVLAKLVARAALRVANMPGRRLRGTFRRKASRRVGGRRFRVTAPDGAVLDAWHLPARAAAGGPVRLPVVMCHGWLENKETHFDAANLLAEHGHDVVLFDHRIHGNSTGSQTTFGVLERHDLQAVIEDAATRGIVGERIITMGFSLGGGTVLQHATMSERVAGVVALAPFSDLRYAIDSFRDFFTPWIPDQWLMRGFAAAAKEAGFELDEASTLEAARQIRVPVLLVEAALDRNLPPAHHTGRLREAMREAGVPLKCLCVEGACHTDLCRKTWPGMHEAIARFCDRVGK